MDYNGLFNRSEDEDSVTPIEEETPVVEEEMPVVEEEVKEQEADSYIREMNAEAVEESPSYKPEYFNANVDDIGKLRVREAPNGGVLTHVSNKVLLHVLDDSNPEWALVEFDKDSETVTGYVKKSFLVEV